MIDEKVARQHIVDLLEYIGENPQREGLKDTPDRMLRMFKEIFRGYDPAQQPVITTFDNGTDGIVYDDMIIDKGPFYSLCEHHCRTFFGEYYFAYIPHPKGKIIGLSKIGRTVDYCSARLQIQERLARDVVNLLLEALGSDYPPQGIALVLKGRHMCKESRGARKEGYMVSSCLLGDFRDDPATRAEFMRFVESHNI